MSNLPDAVRAAVQQADQDWQQLYGTGEPEVARVVNAPDPTDVLGALENVLPTDPAPQPQPAKEEPTSELVPEPALAQEPAKPPQPDPWEHKYNVLKGKYDTELPQLRAELQTSTRAIQALTAQVEQLQQKQVVEREAALKLTPEEESAFGKDLIDMTRKIARAEAEARAREIDAKLEKTNASVESASKTADQVAQERFLQQVTSAVPDWQEVNARQDWLMWLAQHDPLLGTVRQAALDQAAEARDAQRVAALFGAFKATLPAVPPPAAPGPGTNTVQQQVAPRSQAATPVTPVDQKRLYTEADLQALYSANRRGEFARDQWAQISAEIDLAVSEGRVR